MKPVYSTQVRVEGGRNGHAVSTDGNLDIQFALPKEFGGEGKRGTNPEQLLAAGYAACFEMTLRFIGGQKKLPITAAHVLASVDVYSDPTGGYKLGVDLEITLAGIDRLTSLALIEDAKKVCPYHKMGHGNIEQRYHLAG